MKIHFQIHSATLGSFNPFFRLRSFHQYELGYYKIWQRWALFFKSQFNEKVEIVEDPTEADAIINPLFIIAFDTKKISYTKGHNISFEDTPILTFKSATNSIAVTEGLLIENIHHLLSSLNTIITLDFELLNSFEQYLSDKLSEVKIHNKSKCIIGNGSRLRNSVLDATNGPIIIGENVEIKDFAVIEGPIIINSNSVIMPNTHIRSGSIIGKKCTIGGEVKHSLIQSNSNKGHYGYLGDSILGEYCNLGAGTTTSNLKNNFSTISYFSPKEEKMISSESNKLGSFIGDFSMTAVNTVLNAGTVIGVHCNIFGIEKTPKFVGDFSWGLEEDYKDGLWQKTSKQLLINKGASESEINELIDNLGSLFEKV